MHDQWKSCLDCTWMQECHTDIGIFVFKYNMDWFSLPSVSINFKVEYDTVLSFKTQLDNINPTWS